MAEDGGAPEIGPEFGPDTGPDTGWSTTSVRVDEAALRSIVRAAVEEETASLRAAVDEGMAQLAARTDEILGGGLGDLAIRFGEQLKALRTASAAGHDDRRVDAQTANRVRAMEDRLDDVLRRLASSTNGAVGLQVEEITSGIDALGRRLGDQLDRGVGRAVSRVDEVEARTRYLEETLLRLETGIAGLREVVEGQGGSAAADKRTAAVVKRMDELAERISSVDERVAGVGESLAGVDERLAQAAGEADQPDVPGTDDEAMSRALDNLGRRLSDHIDRGLGRAVSRVDEVEARTRHLEETLLRLETAVSAVREDAGDRAAARAAPADGLDAIGATLDDIVERIDVLEQLFAILVEGDPRREEERRRALVAELARALEGHVCPVCGHVSPTAGGLASHQRTHSGKDAS